MKTLTKSRFKLALSCPTKLYYTKKAEYENTSEADPFLQALAEGGFQVEELARMYFPGGHAILGEDWDYQKLHERTQKLLQQEDVVIFEAAFLYKNLFVRVDILEKKGNTINLYEVKAKSIDSTSHDSFLNRKGSDINGGWREYLYDVAFQQYVMQQCYPKWHIRPYLTLVDKSKKATVDGLNQCFKIRKDSDLRTGIIKKEGLTLNDLGDSLLTSISVKEEIRLIHENNPAGEGLSFEDHIVLYCEHYLEDKKMNNLIGKHCRGCEFNSPEHPEKSGFHQCWSEQLELSYEAINRPKVFDIWNFRSSAKLMEQGKLFLEDLCEADVDPQPEAGKISNSERRWIQVQKTLEADQSPYLEIDGLRDEMRTWKYPLNFIDFETSAVALPFTKDRRPYEQIAFQFSHHIVYEDGRVEHASEFLNVEPGVFPNFEFIRALKIALSQNEGSIFRYHNHENTIVCKIWEQLHESDEPDKEALMAFIESISHSTGNMAKSWRGHRDMIDLYRVVKDYYYDPATNGSISIKAVLPAVLHSSNYLQQKYSKSLSDLRVTSRNFGTDKAFLIISNGKVVSPYKSLEPLFKNWSEEELDSLVSGMDHVADGGAALTAYSKLQFEEIDGAEREAIKQGLLRYCELDTLAMVMIYEYFREVVIGSR